MGLKVDKCLDLCCGPQKPEGYIGIDIIPFNCVDTVCDINNGIPFDDDTFNRVRAHDAIEHIWDGMKLIKEIWRVLKDGGIFDCLVPSTDGRGAFQDQTHVSFWNENSFGYWVTVHPWADYYRGKCLFSRCELETTPMSDDRVCHVKFVASAVKNSGWINTIKNRIKSTRRW